MRQRSKSMFVEKAPEGGSKWEPVEDLRLIRGILQQIPKRDTVPYSERLGTIRWDELTTEDRTAKDVENHFTSLLENIRNYRILSEMLKDLEKATRVNLPLLKKKNIFAIFLEENKEELRRKMSQSGEKCIFTRFASQQFKQLSEEEKQKYIITAEQMNQSHKDFYASYDIEQKTPNRAGRPEDVHHPAAFLWKHKKKKDENMTFSAAKKLYATLNRTQKIKWILQFLEVEKGQKLSLQQYNKAQKMLSKDDIVAIDEYEGRPKKLSAYNCFMKDFLGNSDNNRGNWKGRFKEAIEEWKNLGPKKKEKYEKIADEMRKTYVDEYIEFIKSLPSDRQTIEMNKILHKDKKSSVKRKSKSISGTDSTRLDLQDEEVLAVIETSQQSKNDTEPRNVTDSSASENEEILSPDVELSPVKKRRKPNSLEGSANEDNKSKNIFTKVDPPSITKKKKKLNSMSEASDQHECETSILNSLQQSISKSTRKIKLSTSEASDPQEYEPSIMNISDRSVNKSKKKKNSLSEASDQQESFTSIMNASQETIPLSEKLPSSVYKYYATMIYSGPKEKAKRSFKRLSYEEIEAVTKKYEKAKRKYLKAVEKQIKSPPHEESQKCFSQDEISNEMFSGFSDSN